MRHFSSDPGFRRIDENIAAGDIADKKVSLVVVDFAAMSLAGFDRRIFTFRLGVEFVMTENLDRVHMICQICENEDEDDPRRLHPDSDVTELCHDIPVSFYSLSADRGDRRCVFPVFPVR